MNILGHYKTCRSEPAREGGKSVKDDVTETALSGVSSPPTVLLSSFVSRRQQQIRRQPLEAVLGQAHVQQQTAEIGR